MKKIVIATNFEPKEYVILPQSTEIDTHENKVIYTSLHHVRLYEP